ncbi:hypothetical protein Tcan_13547 [Toxocara canis]|uniref:Uncharacterized protein n=1 Tax=Toxocara canis TaxID=6265 RepID=A0A0B2V6D1_TOXCA|nr:hypothetical protein Tcan_13547 [Toxocara canis]
MKSEAWNLDTHPNTHLRHISPSHVTVCPGRCPRAIALFAFVSQSFSPVAVIGQMKQRVLTAETFDSCCALTIRKEIKQERHAQHGTDASSHCAVFPFLDCLGEYTIANAFKGYFALSDVHDVRVKKIA